MIHSLIHSTNTYWVSTMYGGYNIKWKNQESLSFQSLFSSSGNIFILFMGFSWQGYWSGLPFPPPGDRGWDGWIVSPTQWTWVWVNSGSWWPTGKPGMLQSMGLQRIRYDWAIDLNWTIELWMLRVVCECWNFTIMLPVCTIQFWLSVITILFRYFWAVVKSERG